MSSLGEARPGNNPGDDVNVVRSADAVSETRTERILRDLDFTGHVHPDEVRWLAARVHTLERALAGGAGLIAAERTRQVAAEGWSAGHDDAHDDGALAIAAATYALPRNIRDLNTLPRDTAQRKPLWLCLWPWNQKWWKPTPDDRVRELVKAGALIAAEIDRLARAVVLEGAQGKDFGGDETSPVVPQRDSEGAPT